MLPNNKIKSKEFINLYTTIKGLEQDQFCLFLHHEQTEPQWWKVDGHGAARFTESLTAMCCQRVSCPIASQVIASHAKSTGADEMIPAHSVMESRTKCSIPDHPVYLTCLYHAQRSTQRAYEPYT